MHFALTPEQELARTALRELLAEHCTAAHLRKVFEAEQPTRIPSLWARLHELGMIGALAPEAVGGIGLNAIDLTVLLEETGRAAVPEPLVETAFVAVPLLAAVSDNPHAVQLLQQVLSGKLSISVALGESTLVPAAGLADLILCERRGELHALTGSGHGARDAASGGAHPSSSCCAHTAHSPHTASSERTHAANSGAAREAAISAALGATRSGARDAASGGAIRLVLLESVDRARPLYQLEVDASDATCIARGNTTLQLLAAARDHAALGTAAQLVGLGWRMLDLTINHVKTRRQFGQPVGAFQAVKHQLVDARLALEFAAPLVYRAAHSVAHHDPARSLHVSMAKAYASEAALLTARKALQLHGAIGYSYEYELHMYMKRAWALAAAYGDAREHRQRIAEVVLTAQGESYA